jgi:hypothetical protein
MDGIFNIKFHKTPLIFPTPTPTHPVPAAFNSAVFEAPSDVGAAISLRGRTKERDW